MKVDELLMEEKEFWSDYPGMPTNRAYASNMKNDIADEFKMSARSINVKQFLPKIDGFVQEWTFRLPKKMQTSAELIKSLLIKFMTARYKRSFKHVGVSTSWINDKGATIFIRFNLSDK